jgi:hydrogenase/urease accessory protein HupE
VGGVIAVMAAYLIVGLWEIIPLRRQKKRKVMIVYIVFWAAAFGISLMLVAGVRIPSLERALIHWYYVIFEGGS